MIAMGDKTEQTETDINPTITPAPGDIEIAGEEDTDNTIDVSIEGEGDDKNLPEIPGDETDEPAGEDENPAIADLRAQLSKVQRSLEDSEAARRAEADVAARNSEYDAIVSAIEGETAKRDAAKKKLAEAWTEGNYEAAADVESDLAESAAKLTWLNEAKIGFERERENAKNQPRQPQRQGNDGGLEAKIADWSEDSKKWARAHPEFLADDRKIARLVGAHNFAVADGIEVDTPEYFAAINKTLGIGKTAAKTAEKTDAPAKAKPKPSYAAAPSRSAPAGKPGQQTVRLTPEEVDAAEQMGLSPKDYARSKLALIKEGRIS